MHDMICNYFEHLHIFARFNHSGIKIPFETENIVQDMMMTLNNQYWTDNVLKWSNRISRASSMISTSIAFFISQTTQEDLQN